MKMPIGEMSVGDILDRGLKLFFHRFGTFYGIMFLVLLPSLAYTMYVSLDTSALPVDQDPDALGSYLGSLFAGLLAVACISIIFTPIGTAAMLHVIAQEFLGNRVGFGSALKFGLNRFGSVLLVSIMVGLVTALGYMMLVIPGIIFSIWYIFAQQVVVVERFKGGTALARSKDLTLGYRWKIFQVAILLGIIQVLAGVLIGMLQSALPNAVRVATDQGVALKPIPLNIVINHVVQYAGTTATSCFALICMTLYYFNLRIKKEGLDLELALAGIDEESPQPIPRKPDFPLEEDFGPP